MDSTFVHQIPEMVSTLGGQARFVLVWYFMLKFGVHLLWAAVVLSVFRKALGLVKHGSDAMRLNSVLQEAAGTEHPKAQHYAAAERSILEALQGVRK